MQGFVSKFGELEINHTCFCSPWLFSLLWLEILQRTKGKDSDGNEETQTITENYKHRLSPAYSPRHRLFYSPFLKVSSSYTVFKSALSSVFSTTQAEEDIYLLQLCLTSPLWNAKCHSFVVISAHTTSPLSRQRVNDFLGKQCLKAHFSKWFFSMWEVTSLTIILSFLFLYQTSGPFFLIFRILR